MVIVSSERYVSKQNGHGYDKYESEALCSSCGRHLANLVRYSKEGQPTGLDKDWTVCPYCGVPLCTQSNKGAVKSVYYSHPIWKFNTEIEKYELALIKKHFPNAKIVNPNEAVNQTDSEPAIMANCFACLKQCESIVFSSLSGVVGYGVMDEVELAKSEDKQIYYLSNHDIKLAPDVNFERIQDFDENRIFALVKI